MKKILIFLGILFLVGVITVSAVSAVSAVLPVQQLELDVNNVSYFVTDYEIGRFDCSNMAAQMVEELNAKGYDAEIVVVCTKQSYLDKWNMVGERDYHAFVIIDRQAIVEPTLKLITFTEGKYGNYKTIDWYLEAWEVIGVYSDRDDAIKRSKWGYLEWHSLYLSR